MSWLDQIALESNVVITAEERGKLRRDLCRDFKNIWTYTGREWVTRLMSFAAVAGAPPPFADDDRAAMMGFGVGGNQQSILPIGGAVDADYPGLNVQDNSNADITYLERPVRVLPYMGLDDYWLRQFKYDYPTEWGDPLPSTTRYVRWFAIFDYGEIDGPWAYPMVPISEIGLFTSAYFGAAGEWDDINNVYDYPTPPGYVGVRPAPVAYHTFPSIPKTASIKLTVRWEVRVGG